MITEEQVRNSIHRARITWIPVRACSLCNRPIGYRVLNKDTVIFDGSCGCASGPPRPASFAAIADLVNQNWNSVRFRDRMLRGMKLDHLIPDHVVFCAPKDSQRPKWLLTFEDADRGHSIYEDESEAYAAFARANDMGSNCYLWQLAPKKEISG